MRNQLFIGAAVAALIAPASVQAQEVTSVIRGTVTNNGAPVAGATVTALHVPSGTRSTATTDENGGFTITGLRAGGPFTVSVNNDQAQVTDINTVIGTPYDLPIELADFAQDIVVTAASVAGAGNISQGPATVLTSDQIANIASVNRDIRDLQRRDPFARLDDSPTGGRAISFAGQNARFNRFSVDGVAITDNFGLNTDGLPSRRSPIPLDAIGQFQARVAPYDVREGNFQGGAINIVLRSGTNDFQGTGFYAFQNENLVGKRTKPGPGIPTGRSIVPNFELKNYGAELSGPIIPDRLFFMVAGERLRGGRPIPEGPTDNNSGTAIPNLSQAQVDRVVEIANRVYGYNAGNVQRDLNDRDDRLVAKLDANLSDSQRASLTYTYAKDGITLLNNTFSSITTGSPGLGLSSNAYTQGNRLHTGVFQLNSEWSDDFSTEFRAFYKNYRRIQDPLLGRGFAQLRICTNETSIGSLTGCEAGSIPAGQGTAAVVSIGPDNSRQTNELTSESYGALIQARLIRGDHDIRVFGEFQDTDIFNSFLQNSAGNYYFDSFADFEARRAGSIAYQNAVPSLDPDRAAAKFDYQLYTFGLMDNWKVTDNLNISIGARYDLFGGTARPALNPNFVARYANGLVIQGEQRTGFTNQAILAGRGLFQPRFGFDWKPTTRLTLRGGGGIFGGGAPDVYVSNSFSNTGILTSSISINRTATGFTGFPSGTPATVQTTVGTAALNNVTGRGIPTEVNNFVAGTTALTNATTNALDPNFKIPSQWRATLSADYDADLGPLGDGWNFGADFFYSKVRNQVFFTDIRSQPIPGSLTPDGRQRYSNIIDGATSTNTNTDILLTNTDRGRSYVGVVRFDKTWKFGLNLFGSFTYQDVKDQAPATSSTAGSNYTNGAFVDPNNVSYGISNDQVRYFFKYGATFERAFFGDYKTTIALFGETRQGRPFSYTFQDFQSAGGNPRSAVFGTTGRSTATNIAGNRYLIYVPTANDPRVSFSSPEFQAAFDSFVNSSGLAKYRGRVAPRNGFNSPWFTRLDLHLSQEIPVPGWSKARVTIFADVENFTNLINRRWGQLREYVFPFNAAVAQVTCLQTAVPTGVAPTAAQTTANVSQPCVQYRYSPLQNGSSFQTPTDQVYVNQSLYAIRLGARFSF